MSKNNNCPLCGSASIRIFLTRRKVPVHQNLLIRDRERATKIARGDLELAVCEKCGFIFNQGFRLSELRYGEEYDNTQTHSPFFAEYISNLIDYLIFEKKVQNCRVLEVGCGKGLFLRKMVEIEDAGNSGYGFDPSYNGPEVELEGRLQFAKRYYGPDCAGISADVVICRHVIEHVPDPMGLLHSIRQALINSPQARVFVETPCVGWILRKRVIWDFFYEHCSYFTAGSLTTAFAASGFHVEDARHLFGGQYLWLEAKVSNLKPAVIRTPASIPQLATRYARLENDMKTCWQIKLKKLAGKGKIAIWGAGAKGVTFANLIDPACEWIDCVVDLNPQKQGCYLPGTGHPIVNYQDLGKRGVTTTILMNPNYHAEIKLLLQKSKFKINLFTGSQEL